MIPVNSSLQRLPVVTTEASYSSAICTTTNTVNFERGTFTVVTGKFFTELFNTSTSNSCSLYFTCTSAQSLPNASQQKTDIKIRLSLLFIIKHFTAII